MTSTKELIKWIDMRLKRISRESPKYLVPEEDRLNQIRAKLIAAEKMAETLKITDVLDCYDNSCMFAKERGGQRTNGGCRCHEKYGRLFCRIIKNAQTTLAEWGGGTK